MLNVFRKTPFAYSGNLMIENQDVSADDLRSLEAEMELTELNFAIMQILARITYGNSMMLKRELESIGKNVPNKLNAILSFMFNTGILIRYHQETVQEPLYFYALSAAACEYLKAGIPGSKNSDDEVDILKKLVYNQCEYSIRRNEYKHLLSMRTDNHINGSNGKLTIDLHLVFECSGKILNVCTYAVRRSQASYDYLKAMLPILEGYMDGAVAVVLICEDEKHSRDCRNVVKLTKFPVFFTFDVLINDNGLNGNIYTIDSNETIHYVSLLNE